MTIYKVTDHLDIIYGSYSSREKAVRMAGLLEIWYTNRMYYVEEIYCENGKVV